ncbi:hypothetical protein LPJ59_005089, partial [Coemansia sp. RSA 2399]
MAVQDGLLQRLNKFYDVGMAGRFEFSGYNPPMDTGMLKFSAAIRSQEDWMARRNDTERRLEWYMLGKGMGLCSEDVTFVLNELEYYVRISKPESDIRVGFYDMIWISEHLLDDNLRVSLVSQLDMLKLCPLSRNCIAKHDHFFLEHTSLCLMCPSMHVLDFNRTLFIAQDEIRSPEAALDYMGHGTCPGACEKWDALYEKLDERHQIGWDYMDSGSKYCWRSRSMLPCEVDVDSNGKARLVSYVNNLHPVRHRGLYRTIEEILARMIPLFEEVLTDMVFPSRLRVFNDICCWTDMRPKVPPIDSLSLDFTADFIERYTQWYHTRLYVPTSCGEFTMPDRPNRPYSLRNHRLQVAVKAVEYNLPVSSDQKRTRRIDLPHTCLPNVCIIATALYCYDTENVLTVKYTFMADYDEDGWEYYHEFDSYPRDSELEEEKEGSDDDVEDRFYHDGTLEPSRSFATESVKLGKCMCYSALYHCDGCEIEVIDTNKSATVKVFVAYLVNPATRVMSTAMIPPQQIDWLLDAVFRLATFRRLPIL